MRIASIVILAACGSSSGMSNPSTDAPSGGDSQHVVECAGTVASSQPSACPHGDCNETGAGGEKCTAYASWVPGSMQGVCNSGQTGSFGVLFAKAPGQLGSYFYEVVECNAGAPTLHACTSGFTTDPQGYNGMPGFVCTH